MQRSYPCYTDNAQAWVRVPRADLMELAKAAGRDLRIGGRGDSRMAPGVAYLDEERDFAAYRTAAERAGWTVAIEGFRHTGKRSAIRDMLPLDSKVLSADFVGASVDLEGGRGRVIAVDRGDPGDPCYVVRVTEAAEGSGLDASQLGGVYSVPAREAARYISGIRPHPSLDAGRQADADLGERPRPRP